jgi:hypothetical protein
MTLPRNSALLMSRCSVQQSLFDDLTVDGFLPLVPSEEVIGDCYSWPRIRNADKPSTIAYIGSGGSMSTSAVDYGAQGDIGIKRIAAQVRITKDVFFNLGANEHAVGEDQALAIAALLQEEIGRQLWAITPSTDAPKGMVAFANDNPNGVLTPAAGVGTRLRIGDLGCVARMIGQWLPSSFICYVMPPKLYFELHDLAQSYGAPLQYVHHPVIGGQVPILYGFPVVSCGFIPPDDVSGTTSSVYLVRIGRGKDDPAKIAGLVQLHPPGGADITVGPFLPDSNTPDELVSTVSKNWAIAARSATSVSRLSGVKYQ